MKFAVDRRRVKYFMWLKDIQTQQELVRVAGLGWNTVTKLLDGSTFTSTTVEKLADALNCNPIDLLSTEGYPAPHVDAQALAAID